MNPSRAIGDLILILDERGRQYGNGVDDKANLRESLRLGIDPMVGVLVRAGDKWGRICSLSQDEMWDPEQMRDNAIDLAGYMIKYVELLDERYHAAATYSASEAGGLEPLDNPDPEPHERRGLRSLFGW